MQLIRALHEIFAEAQLPLWLRPYEASGAACRTRWEVTYWSAVHLIFPNTLPFSARTGIAKGLFGHPRPPRLRALYSTCYAGRSWRLNDRPTCCFLATGAAHQQPDRPHRDGAQRALHSRAQVQVPARHQVRKQRQIFALCPVSTRHARAGSAMSGSGMHALPCPPAHGFPPSAPLPPRSLRDHLLARHGGAGTPSFLRAQRCFAESLAAYSLVCYLLQIKDRWGRGLGAWAAPVGA